MYDNMLPKYRRNYWEDGVEMLKSLSKAPVSEEAFEQIRQLIAGGQIKVGDQLPSEHQLGDMLGISRTTVRAALIALQTEGYIEIKRGKGAFVIDKSLFDQQRFLKWFLENKFKIKELMESRMAIESMAAFWAADRIEPGDLDRLSQLNTEIEIQIRNKNIKEIVRIDEQFHEIIINATQNQLMRMMYSVIVPALHEYRSRAFSPPANPNLAIEGHTRIVEALCEGSPQQSFAAMIGHLQQSLADIEGTAKGM